jgi:MFS family permease
LQLEQRTWEEVRDLSLNFFLVSPLLKLPFSPVVHPILEGVFNLLLSWAALFAGFFSDERDDKPNLFPIIPAVLGMQFLTSAFYLPYIACRTTERLPSTRKIYREDLGKAAQVVESRLLGPFLGAVGAGSIIWGVLARQADFGDWNERIASFWNLMSIDRVGSSFLVDLAIFAVFQGWLVDDDLRRRGVDLEKENSVLRNVAKYVPFFGLAAYMALRPQYPSRQDES